MLPDNSSNNSRPSQNQKNIQQTIEIFSPSKFNPSCKYEVNKPEREEHLINCNVHQMALINKMMPKGFKFELMEVLEKTLEQHRKKNIGLANYQFKRPEIQNEKKQERIFQKYRQRRQRERLENRFSQQSSPQGNKEKLFQEEEKTWKSLQQLEKINRTEIESVVETKKQENNKNSSIMFRRNLNQVINQENLIGDNNLKKKKLQDENQDFHADRMGVDDIQKICIGDDNYKGQLKLKVNTTKNKSLVVSGNTNTRTHSSQFDGLSEEVKSIDNQLLFKHQARITLQEGYESTLFKEDDQLDFYSIMVKLLEAILDHECLKKIAPKKPKFLQRPDSQFQRIREISKENEGEGYLSFKDILQRLRYKKYGPGKNSIRMGMVLSNIRSVFIMCNKYFSTDLESQKIAKILENFFENEIASVLQFRQTITGEVLVSLKNLIADKNQMKQQWPITSLDINIIKNPDDVQKETLQTQTIVAQEITSNNHEQINDQSLNSKKSESKRQQKQFLKDQKKLKDMIGNKGSTTESESSFHPLVKNKTFKIKNKEKKKLKKEQKRLLKQSSETVSSNSSSADKEEMEKNLALFNIITKELTNEQKKQIIPIVKPDCQDQKNKQKFEFDLFSLSPQVFSNLEKFVNECIAKKQQTSRHLYDLSKPNEPYLQDRRILKEKICLLNLEQLRGIIPIVKDKALQKVADEDDLKLEFDLFDLEESKCKELHNYIEACLQQNDEKQDKILDQVEPRTVSPQPPLKQLENRVPEDEVNEELLERLSLFNEIKQLDQTGLDLLGFVMTHPDFLSIGQGLKNGEQSTGQQLEVNCGDTIMLDLKELNIVKVRFLKKLLNDNQMKALYSQMLLQQQQGDLQDIKNEPQLNFENKLVPAELNNQLQKPNEIFQNENNYQQNVGQINPKKIGQDFMLNIQPNLVVEENIPQLYDNSIFQKEQEEAKQFYAEQEQIYLNNEQQLQEQLIDQHNQLEQTQILTRQISELLYYYHERINPNPQINIQNLIKNIEALPENIRCLDFQAAQETLRCSIENEEILKQNITNLEEFRKSQLLIWSEFLNSQRILQKQRIQQHLTWLVDKDKNNQTQNALQQSQAEFHPVPTAHINTTVKQPSPQIMKQEIFQHNLISEPEKFKTQEQVPEKFQNSDQLAYSNLEMQMPIQTNEINPIFEQELQELYSELQIIQNSLSQMEQIHCQLTSLHAQKLQFLKPEDNRDELKQIEDSITQVVTQYNSLCDQQASNQQKILEIQTIQEEQQAHFQNLLPQPQGISVLQDGQKYVVDYQNLIQNQNQFYPPQIGQDATNLGYQFMQPSLVDGQIQMAQLHSSLQKDIEKNQLYYSNGEPVVQMKVPNVQVETIDQTPRMMIPQVNGVFQNNQQFQVQNGHQDQEQQQYFYDPDTNQVYYADNDGFIYQVDQGQVDLQKPDQQNNFYYELTNQNNDNQNIKNHQNPQIYYNFAMPQDVQQNQEFVFENLEANQQNQQYFQDLNVKQQKFLNQVQDKNIIRQAQRPLVIISQPDQGDFKNQQQMTPQIQLEQSKVWPQAQEIQQFQTDVQNQQQTDKGQNMQEVGLQLQQMLSQQQQQQYGEELYYMNEGDQMYKPYYVTREGMMVEEGGYQEGAYPVIMYDQGQGEMYYYQGYEDQKERKSVEGTQVLNTRENEECEQSQALIARN